MCGLLVLDICADAAKEVGDKTGAVPVLDSPLEWLCGCKSWLGCSELLLVALESFPVPDNEDVNRSAKKPSRLEELNPSDLSMGVLDRMLLFVSWSLGVARKRVVAGVCRGVASLEVRLLGSVPSSGDDDLLISWWL